MCIKLVNKSREIEFYINLNDKENMERYNE